MVSGTDSYFELVLRPCRFVTLLRDHGFMAFAVFLHAAGGSASEGRGALGGIEDWLVIFRVGLGAAFEILTGREARAPLFIWMSGSDPQKPRPMGGA